MWPRVHPKPLFEQESGHACSHVGQESAGTFREEPESKHFRPCSLLVRVATTQLHGRCMRAALDYT